MLYSGKLMDLVTQCVGGRHCSRYALHSDICLTKITCFAGDSVRQEAKDESQDVRERGSHVVDDVSDSVSDAAHRLRNKVCLLTLWLDFINILGCHGCCNNNLPCYSCVSKLHVTVLV